jgi:hypothetical protein
MIDPMDSANAAIFCEMEFLIFNLCLKMDPLAAAMRAADFQTAPKKGKGGKYESAF